MVGSLSSTLRLRSWRPAPTNRTPGEAKKEPSVPSPRRTAPMATRLLLRGMLDVMVVSESLSAVVPFTLSTQHFDDSAMNSSYCSCECISSFCGFFKSVDVMAVIALATSVTRRVSAHGEQSSSHQNQRKKLHRHKLKGPERNKHGLMRKINRRTPCAKKPPQEQQRHDWCSQLLTASQHFFWF